MWSIQFNLIYGFGIGLEVVPDEEGGPDAWIVDLLFIRLVIIKED